ncbi:MAG TPA: RDD family protein [Bacillales bacterium]|nr:RDD family protein [Bacillales bacterium]
MVQSPAGFWIRLGALILDGIIVGIPMIIIGTIAGWGDHNQTLVSDAISLLYSIILPIIWSGYTIGKRICGIRIVKMDGSNPSVGTMLLRVIVAGIVDGITLGIAVIVSAFMVGLRKDKRAIHDFIAGTYVTHEKPE